MSIVIELVEPELPVAEVRAAHDGEEDHRPWPRYFFHERRWLLLFGRLRLLLAPMLVRFLTGALRTCVVSFMRAIRRGP
jgi:hypothetical protein